MIWFFFSLFSSYSEFQIKIHIKINFTENLFDFQCIPTEKRKTVDLNEHKKKSDIFSVKTLFQYFLWVINRSYKFMEYLCLLVNNLIK